MVDKFNLNVGNGHKVELEQIKKKEISEDAFKENTNKSIFNALDENHDQKLSGAEIGTFLDLVKKYAKGHNKTNLGNKEFKNLQKELVQKFGQAFVSTTKAQLLNFISTLHSALAAKPKEEVKVEQSTEQTGQIDQNKNGTGLSTKVNERMELPQDNDASVSQKTVAEEKPVFVRTGKKIHLPKQWSNQKLNNTELFENTKNADEVLDKLVSEYNIDKENVQMEKLKADLIKYNPSIFNNQGQIYQNVDWSKFDFPSNVNILYKKGVKAPSADRQNDEQNNSSSGSPVDLTLPTTHNTIQPSTNEQKAKTAATPAKAKAPEASAASKTAKKKPAVEKIITTEQRYHRGIKYQNGNSIEAEDKKSIWDSDALFTIGKGKYNIKRSRSGMFTSTADYGDLRSSEKFIDENTGMLNPKSRLFESQYDRNPERIYFSGDGELNGATVLEYKGKVAVQLKGKYYDLNMLIQQNKKVEIK